MSVWMIQMNFQAQMMISVEIMIGKKAQQVSIFQK